MGHFHFKSVNFRTLPLQNDFSAFYMRSRYRPTSKRQLLPPRTGKAAAQKAETSIRHQISLEEETTFTATSTVI